MSGDSVTGAQQIFQFASSGSTPTSPHQFYIKKISVEQACRMNGVWHSRLPIIKPGNVYRNKKQICYGFFLNQICYAVAIWTSPISSSLPQGTWLELRRYAIRKDAPKNTASWGLSKMVKFIHKEFPDLIKLISYQDTLVHTGTIYKASGWGQGIKTKFSDWSHKTRKRNVMQSRADKIRWELDF